MQCIPVIRNEDFQSLLAEGTRKQEILKKIALLSEEYKKAGWINDPQVDPTEQFFMKCVKRGFTYRNFLDAMQVFPKRFLIARGPSILLSKSWAKALRSFRSEVR